ncbi:MAG: type II secretion system secretin GspD [Parvularculaceae bacterium]
MSKSSRRGRGGRRGARPIASRGSNRRALLATIAACVATAAPALAQDDECGEAINYERADVNAVIDEMARRTGKKFVVAPQVNGTITIKSGGVGGLCADEAWELFQAALRASGFVAAPINGGSYNIVPIQQGPRSAGPVGEGRPGDIVTQIVRLKYIEAREAAASLTQISGERGLVNPIRSGNAVIIVDTADNVVRLRKVIREIDRDTRVARTIQLQHASASETARVISQLAQELSEENGGQGGGVSVVPVEASNSVIIRAEPVILRRIVSVVNELDQAGQAQSDLVVLRLRHANAEDLAETLREIANVAQQSSVVEGASPTSSRTTISVDPPTNSIIISADADMQQRLRRAVAELDLRPSQVQVEAIIVDISESTARELGVQYLVSGSGDGVVPFTTTNFTSGQSSLLAAAASSGLAAGGTTEADDPLGFDNEVLQAALGSLLGLNGFALGGAGQTDNGNIFAAVVTAIKQDSESRILSLPSVVTLDNQPARLQVGQEIPITPGEATGDNFSGAFRTVSREEVGVILEVTPRINEGGTVTLELRQEISSVEGQIISDSTDLITNQTVIETTALVDDGDILVIGGLVEQNDQLAEDKVPLLGDVPVLGNLFKNSGRSRDRGSLMIFIRPTIIQDQARARAATKRKIDYIRARELISSGKPTSELERLIDQVTGTDPVFKPDLPLGDDLDAPTDLEAPLELRPEATRPDVVKLTPLSPLDEETDLENVLEGADGREAQLPEAQLPEAQGDEDPDADPGLRE